jgi:hypothetical protein
MYVLYITVMGTRVFGFDIIVFRGCTVWAVYI